ncbi:MAG: histidine kinase [Dehalococcoidia bacterium]
MTAQSREKIEERIAEIKRRIPPHSVPPAMLQEIEELEEQLAKMTTKENAR